jgi:hypothetical protein
MFASICGIRTQASTPTGNMQTFFDSNIPGIHVQVNATAESQPGQNITLMLSLKQQNQTTIHVEYFKLSVFGFVNGTSKILVTNITGNSFYLGSSPSRYNRTFTVPQQVWDVTYGEITLTYNATYAFPMITVTIPYQNITSGFTMTQVENVYLETVKEQLTNLQAESNQLEQNYTSLEGNLSNLQARYNHLQQNYTTLQGNLSDLNNTRSAAAVLAVTSLFFLATTVYLIIRKPKDYY